MYVNSHSYGRVRNFLDKLGMKLEKIKDEQQPLFEQIAMVEIDEASKGFEAHLNF